MQPIAIIGIGCRFPGADSPESFWRLLVNGVDAITALPASRWKLEDFYDDRPEAPGKMNSRWGGFLEGIDLFDASFFGISPREARQMDPQQRLVLEVAWEALEDAGQAIDRLSGTRVGVFVGVMNTEFGDLYLRRHNLVNTQLGAGSSAGIVANRLSYCLNLRGPSVVVDTLCSSSLVAIHLACQSIWNGESTPLALAGGVNAVLHPTMNIFYAKSGLTAPDGRCKAFDARANGIVRGEGAGIVVLKTLERARADGDPIYCVIRGSAVNHDGRTNGLTAPNRWSQIELLEEAYRRAGVSPGQIRYVEAHGTGTPLGDPIELKALGSVLAIDRPKHGCFSVGSVKTNIGHLESAAAIASVIKTALILKHRTLVPSLHFRSPNPYIPFDELPLKVQQVVERLPEDAPILAGVSSFGLGGTNAHAVLESFQADPSPATATEPPSEEAGQPRLLPLSARGEPALRALAAAYVGIAGKAGSRDSRHLLDLCYTAAVRRSHHDFRLAIVGRSAAEFEERLRDYLDQRSPAPGLFKGRRSSVATPGLAFVFGGQGSQWAGMGVELLDCEPVFRGVVEQCEELISGYVGWSLIDELRAEPERSRLQRTEIAQPAIFAVQAGLATVWKSWGLKPDALLGHSVGEVAAAYVAGALSIEDAVAVIFQRGRLMERTSGMGRMLALKTGRASLGELLAGYEQSVSVAAVNGRDSVTLSGDPSAIESLFESLSTRGAVGKILPGDYGFHSPQMEPLKEELVQALRGIHPRKPEVLILSTLTGQPCEGGEFGPSYWARQIREPVLFAPALDNLIENGIRFFVEVSPHPVLTGAISQALRQHATRGARGAAVCSTRRGDPARETMLGSLASLYSQGFDVSWSSLFRKGGRSVSLPSYPWQKERLWLEDRPATEPQSSPAGVDRAERGGAGHPVLEHSWSSAVHPGARFWQGEIGSESFPYLNDHRIGGEVVLPASALLEMSLAAARNGEDARAALEGVTFESALTLEAGHKRAVQLVMSPEGDGLARHQVFSSVLADGKAGTALWTRHTDGYVRLGEPNATPSVDVHFEEIRGRCEQVITAAEFYESLERGGIAYGKTFRCIVEIRRREHEAFAAMRIPEEIGEWPGGYQIHPAVLDSCFHLLLSAVSPESAAALYLPVSVERLRVLGHPPREFFAHAVLREPVAAGKESVAGDVTAFDAGGRPLLEVRGLRGRRFKVGRHVVRQQGLQDWLNEVTWKSRPSSATQEAGPPGCWLIFCDRSGVGERFDDLLRARGEQTFLLLAGGGYERLGPNRYVVDSRRPEHFKRVIEEVFAASQASRSQAVHLWSLDADSGSPPSLSDLNQAQWPGCVSLLHFIQALDQTGWKQTPRLLLVTRRAQPVKAGEPVNVVQSSLWGLGKTVSQEFPQLRCANLDLSGESPAADAEIIYEEATGAGVEAQISWRQGERFVAELVPCAATGSGEPLQRRIGIEPELLRTDGAYLITGGLGALGMSVARWMADRGAGNLVLVGRSEPSESALESLAEMRLSGARVCVMQANVASEAATSRLLETIRREMPALRGVIHAAGVLNDGSLLRTDQEAFEKVMEPKVLGAWNLHCQTADLPLDFFVMFSSLASVFGSKGQAAYAAANAFLDGLSHYRRHHGLPATSINWGPWSGAGMAAGLGERMALAGLGSLSPDQGLAVLELVLSEKPVQVAVVPRIGAASGSRPGAATGLFNPNQDGEAAGAFARQLEAAGREERWALLIEHLRAEACAVLGYDDPGEIAIDQNLFDLGMDSLMAVELGSNIQNSLARTFSLSMVFDHPSVEEIASRLARDVLAPELG